MNARELLTYALDHQLVTLCFEQDGDDWDGCNDVDLSRGVDANGYTVDGGLSATLVRRFQAGELANFSAYLRRDKHCDCCGHDSYEVVASVATTLEADAPGADEDTMDRLADEAHGELLDLVDSHKNAV